MARLPDFQWDNGRKSDVFGSLSKHTVTEHEDGTITVSPSILITMRGPEDVEKTWHGFLEKGIWREV